MKQNTGWKNRALALLALTCAAIVGCSHPTYAASTRSTLLESAQGHWNLGISSQNTLHPLTQVGQVELGLDAAGEGAIAGRKIARVTNGYFNAGTGFASRGTQLTAYLRARDPRGLWNYGLFNKRGSVANRSFNLFSVSFANAPNPIIGFEIRTVRGLFATSFPVSEISSTAWHDFVARYDGRYIELICDGKVMVRERASGTLNQNNEPLLIGAESDNGNIVRPFTGELEEAALWSRALTDREVALLTRKPKVTRSAAILNAGKINNFVSPIHYRPAEGIVADTIPFYWKGDYHIFYLLAGLGGTPWAHVVSKDLIHWKELPIALPLGKPTEPDGENVFTGSVIERNGTFHIFYTGYNRALPIRETVMHATSPDLIRWTKQPQNSFTADDVHYDRDNGPDFRDPFVFWNEESKNYWMLLCARNAKDGAPTIGVAVSDDLIKWRQVEPLTGGTPFAPECPDLFKIGDTWYLIFSPSLGYTVYRSAKSLNGPWIDPEVPEIDTQFLYAAKRMFDGRRHVITGWVRDLEGSRDGGGHRWGGHQSVPREVYAAADGRLLSRPVPEATAVFTNTIWSLASKPKPVAARGEWKYQANTLVAQASATGALGSFNVPDNYMLQSRVKMRPQSVFTLGFRTQAQEEAGYHLTVRAETGEVELVGPGFNYKRRCQIDASQPVRIQAFVQGSIIECFINDAHAFSCRAYNFQSGKLSLTAAGGDVQVLDMTLKTPRQLPAVRSSARTASAATR